MASSTTHVAGCCSDFTDLLMKISRSLTDRDLSALKLYVCTEKILKQDDIDEIRFSGDLIRAIVNARQIDRWDCRSLGHMLQVAERADLSSLVRKYHDHVLKPQIPTLQEDKVLGEVTRMEEGDPDSQSSSQESTVSMTDEEKLEGKYLQKYIETDSQDLFD